MLPLVQFEPEEGITFDEALKLIERTPIPETSEPRDSSGAEVLRIDHDVDSGDPFLDKADEVRVIFKIFLNISQRIALSNALSCLDIKVISNRTIIKCLSNWQWQFDVIDSQR